MEFLSKNFLSVLILLFFQDKEGIMIFEFSIKADSSLVSKIAEEAESNESSFIKEFCDDILLQISKQTKELGEKIKEINLVNPYGFLKL